MKQYTLIVGHNFSLANETDSNIQSDYSPGIWAISTQKSALKFARQILDDGNQIRVTDHDNPKYHKLANDFIKKLGLKQELFPEPKEVEQGVVTNGKPNSLASLKKYLTADKKIKVINYSYDGLEVKNERETFVKRMKGNSVVLERDGKDSWLDFGKASDWKFENDGATSHFINKNGEQTKSTKLTYLD